MRLVVRLAPEYVEMLTAFRATGGGLQLPRKFLDLRDHLKINNYSELYDDERKINVSLLLAILGNEGFKELDSEVSKMSPEEQQEFLMEIVQEGESLDISGFFPPENEEEKAKALAELELLSEDEKIDAVKRAQFFWSYFFAHFHNTLSVMVHGEKLTSLVPKAIAGDEGSFCKAIQIDRSLLSYHPFFVQRRMRAVEDSEQEFLRGIAYRERNPMMRGKIRFPALYIVFALLETVNWLDDLKHEEILDICDQANLDRYQSRIEDVGYLTKRLIEYRRNQIT
ncbi:MAG: hypothetical protein ACYCZT_02895 [Thiobacillus sp.]